MPAESETVRQDAPEVGITRGQRDIVQVTRRVGFGEIDGRGNAAMTESLDGEDRLYGTSRTEEVPVRALRGADQRDASCTGEELDRLRLRDIADRCSRAMSVDVVHAARLHPAISAARPIAAAASRPSGSGAVR